MMPLSLKRVSNLTCFNHLKWSIWISISEMHPTTFPQCLYPSLCEVRDRMRTAVGQARLLMKERFGQFSGLVDDCELGRGEKITTCTDLQGFWDMVYYQVG